MAKYFNEKVSIAAARRRRERNEKRRRMLRHRRSLARVRPGWRDGKPRYSNRKYARRLDQHSVDIARRSVRTLGKDGAR